LARIIQQFKINKEKQEQLFHEVKVILSEYVSYILIHLNRIGCNFQLVTSLVGFLGRSGDPRRDLAAVAEDQNPGYCQFLSLLSMCLKRPVFE
jgi:hypothetical protein